jgi:hypothetical protein
LSDVTDNLSVPSVPGLVYDDKSGSWLLPPNKRKPKKLVRPVESVEGEHPYPNIEGKLLDALIADLRPAKGWFRYHKFSEAYDLDFWKPSDLTPIVLRIAVATDRRGLVAISPLDGSDLGRIGFDSPHLIDAFAEASEGALAVRAWVRRWTIDDFSEGTWRQIHLADVVVSLGEPDAVHAAVAEFFAERGRRLVAPARESRFGPRLEPPYTEAVGQSPARLQEASRIARLPFDASSLLAIYGQSIDPVGLTAPVPGEVVEVDGERTHYVALSEVSWRDSSSANSIRSSKATGLDVYAAVHERTAAWAPIARGADGTIGAVDGEVHGPLRVGHIRKGWGLGRSPLVMFDAQGSTWYFGIEQLSSISEDGLGWWWSAPVFSGTIPGARRGSEHVALLEARARAAASARSYSTRAREFGFEPDDVVLFDPWSVFERDHWTCQVCGKPVDRSVAWPDPASATLDHRVPVARRGRHSLDNAQTAHWSCNLVKGDR